MGKTGVKKVRARVVVSTGYEKKTKLWGYSYADFAELFKVKPQTVRLWVSSKQFDPSRLENVIALFNIRNKG